MQAESLVVVQRAENLSAILKKWQNFRPHAPSLSGWPESDVAASLDTKISSQILQKILRFRGDNVQM
jgi:hypothetical protein